MEGLEAAVWLSSPALGGGSGASHLEVAMSVASRSGRRGPGVHAAGTALDLGFVPVTLEDFDIVLGGDAVPAADPLIDALCDPQVQSSMRSLGGYHISRPSHLRPRRGAAPPAPQHRLAELVTSIDPELVSAAFGMRPEGRHPCGLGILGFLGSIRSFHAQADPSACPC